MKKLIVFLMVAMMSVSSFANNEPVTPKEVKAELRTKIVKLLGDVNFEINKEVKTTVDFLINKKGEIVILEIDCTEPSVCAYIKQKLNYKKVAKNVSNGVKVYKMPLRIVKQ